MNGYNKNNTRVIISGEVVEVIKSDRYFKRRKNTKVDSEVKKEPRVLSESEKKARENYSRNRRVKDFIRVVNCNEKAWGEPIFITITFANPITIEDAREEFRKFIRRLNYTIFKTNTKQVKYSYSLEFQDREVPHYHMIVYNSKQFTIEEREKLWKLGTMDIKSVYDANRLAGYMTKEILEGNDDIELGHSQKMIKPLKLDAVDNNVEVQRVLKNVKGEKMVNKFNCKNKYLGGIESTTYKVDGDVLEERLDLFDMI